MSRATQRRQALHSRNLTIQHRRRRLQHWAQTAGFKRSTQQRHSDGVRAPLRAQRSPCKEARGRAGLGWAAMVGAQEPAIVRAVPRPRRSPADVEAIQTVWDPRQDAIRADSAQEEEEVGGSSVGPTLARTRYSTTRTYLAITVDGGTGWLLRLSGRWRGKREAYDVSSKCVRFDRREFSGVSVSGSNTTHPLLPPPTVPTLPAASRMHVRKTRRLPLASE